MARSLECKWRNPKANHLVRPKPRVVPRTLRWEGRDDDSEDDEGGSCWFWDWMGRPSWLLGGKTEQSSTSPSTIVRRVFWFFEPKKLSFYSKYVISRLTSLEFHNCQITSPRISKLTFQNQISELKSQIYKVIWVNYGWFIIL